VSAAPRAARELPFTGVSLLLMTLLGAAMVGIGQTLQRVR
jgi:hypothetical protein